MSKFTGPLSVREYDVDRGLWQTLEPLVWEVDELDSGSFMTVPTGFVTDGASIPFPFSIVLPRWGRWRRAAALHDYLYRVQITTRREADKQFLIALKASDVSAPVRYIFWAAVRLFGRYR